MPAWHFSPITHSCLKLHMCKIELLGLIPCSQPPFSLTFIMVTQTRHLSITPGLFLSSTAIANLSTGPVSLIYRMCLDLTCSLSCPLLCPCAGHCHRSLMFLHWLPAPFSLHTGCSPYKKQVRAPASNFPGASPCTLKNPDFFPGCLRCDMSWIPTLRRHLRLFSPWAWTLLQTSEQLQLPTTPGLHEFARTAATITTSVVGASHNRHLFSEFCGENSELKYPQSNILQIINCSSENAPQFQEPFPVSCPQN